MKVRRKIVLTIGGILVGFLGLAVALLHLPAVQMEVWQSLADRVAATGRWQVTADNVKFRLLPARFEASGFALGLDGETLATVARIEVRWRWRDLARDPRRIAALTIEDLYVTVEPQPSSGPPEGRPIDLDDVASRFEIGVLHLTGGRATGSIAEVSGVVDDVTLDASLENGRASLLIAATRAVLTKSDRDLDLGTVRLEATASRSGIDIAGFECAGPTVAATGKGRTTDLAASGGELVVTLAADLSSAATWWDPNLASGFRPSGRLELEGEVGWAPGSPPAVELHHVGDRLAVAGYPIGSLDLELHGGVPSISAADATWGSLRVELIAPLTAVVAARFDEATVDGLLTAALPRVAGQLTGPVVLGGDIDAVISYPITTDTLHGVVDLELAWRDGTIAVRGEGAGTTWRLDRFVVSTMGVVARGGGRFDLDGRVNASLEVAVADPKSFAESASRWIPQVGSAPVGGGPIEASLIVTGSARAPRFEGAASWSLPVIAGHDFQQAALEIAGDRQSADWRMDVAVAPGASLAVGGTARPDTMEIDGQWRAVVAEISDLGQHLPPNFDVAMSGSVQGEGRFAVARGGYSVDGKVTADAISVAGWEVDRADFSFAADQDSIRVHDLEAALLDGEVAGEAEVPRALDADGLLFDLAWQGINIRKVARDLPPVVEGVVGGEVHLTGSVVRPDGWSKVRWVPAGDGQLASLISLHAAAEHGVVRVVTEDVRTFAGTVSGTATVPIGDLPLPEWIWLGAPGGAVRATIRAQRVNSDTLFAALGWDPIPANVAGDVDIDVEWDPLQPDQSRLVMEATDFSVQSAAGSLIAEGPLTVTIDAGRFELQPVVLVGPATRIEAEALFDPEEQAVAGRLHAVVAPEVSQLLPIPARIIGPIVVEADLEMPVATASPWAEMRGRIRVDHRNGSIVFRDPPLEIGDLVLVADLDDRGLSITDGHARVNRGTVLVGGGWDVASGQGLIVEFDRVNVFMEGILTRWSGQLAVEPYAGHRARVVGDLSLIAGLWDENLDLMSAFLSPATTESDVDDPLDDVILDLAVRGRTGVRVDNNLGQFLATWDSLRVSGTAAEPVLEGEIRIAPGGHIMLAGNEVKVRRGTLRFTGDASVDPIIEIVPEADTTLVGGEEDAGVDVTLLATRGLAQGISSALGFENQTLRPAEIAVQTENDPSVNFMVGQRITRNLALFLSANLTDVQDRTTMLQLWNLRGIEGLVLQGYQDTVDDNLGIKVLQQFKWGAPRTDEGRVEIRRVRLAGKWPVSKRRLGKATRLRRGQPFEPFLLFVATVRLERALAEEGYHRARVEATVRGATDLPTLVFTCDPGPRQVVRFVGDRPPRLMRRKITALFQPKPLEGASFANMRTTLLGHLAAEGYLDARVDVVREGDDVVVSVKRGSKVTISGPVLHGIPIDSHAAIRRLFGTASALATAAIKPGKVGPAVEKLLAADGYRSARVDRVEVVETEGAGLEVHIHADVGERSMIDHFELVGSDPLGVVPSHARFLGPGAPLDRSSIERAARAIRTTYVNEGYLDVRSRATIAQDDAGGWAVRLELNPGPLKTIGKVRFVGADGLSERLLRKGMTVTTGDAVDEAEIDRSATRIANFAPIERVDLQTTAAKGSTIDVEMGVVKKPRWIVEAGAGWSTERGAQASLGLRDDNLFARGVSLDLRASWDAVERRAFLLGTLPPAPGSRLTLHSTVGFRLFDAPDEPDELQQEEKLASLEAQYMVRPQTQVGLYFRYTDTRTYEKEPDEFFPIDIRVRVGIFGARTVIDRFDFLFDPRSGWALSTDLGWSSAAFGSDLEYLRWLSSFNVALEPLHGTTWFQTLRLGAAEPLHGMNLDRDARFFAGGQSSIRGFDLNSVGPAKLGIGGGLVPAGGGGLLILNEELRIPVRGPFRIAVFADIGQVWESWREADFDFAVGAGLGVRWSTPIGPLWADVAWPVANIGLSSSKPKFYVGIGRPF